MIELGLWYALFTVATFGKVKIAENVQESMHSAQDLFI